MRRGAADFSELTDAEDFFAFFALPYDQQIVNVNRLHIMKKFSLHLAEINASSVQLNDEARLARYREALQRAYDVFLHSSAAQEKLFKVFREKPPGLVLLSEISLQEEEPCSPSPQRS